MAGNDIYNDQSGITSCSMRMTGKEARTFMKEVSRNPTHPTKAWVVRNVKTSSRIYYPNL